MTNNCTVALTEQRVCLNDIPNLKVNVKSSFCPTRKFSEIMYSIASKKVKEIEEKSVKM